MSGKKPQDLLLAEAADYFHSHSGLERLLAGMTEKYRTLGRLAGVVVLTGVSREEKTALESFFRRVLPAGSLRISAEKFKTALAETRFGGLDPLAVLAAWQGEPLVSRREKQEQAESRRRRALTALLAKFSQPFCQAWLKGALDREEGTRRVQTAFRRDPRRFMENMSVALRAMAGLPEEYRRLPVFSREICGNPHGLDIDGEAGKLLLEGLAYIRRSRQEECDSSFCTGDGGESPERLSAIEVITELLYHFRLLRDDLLNFVTCIGLAADDRRGEIVYWRRAVQAGAPLNLPLREVVRAVKIYPAAAGRENDAGYEVLVVENSGVFSALLDEKGGDGSWGGKPLVCLHGQPKLASWALLDRLAGSGALLRYAGDFDPEGLQIAQKLLRRYAGRAGLWRMTAADYREAGPSEPIGRGRLNKLRSVVLPELAPLCQLMEQTGLAAYQEGLLAKLAADIEL
ncbi:MAG: TIGR02679 family protein [Veillonellales bacterium]